MKGTSDETTLYSPSPCVRNDPACSGKRDASQIRLLADREEGFSLLLHQDRRRKALLLAGEENDIVMLLQGAQNDAVSGACGAKVGTEVKTRK